MNQGASYATDPSTDGGRRQAPWLEAQEQTRLASLNWEAFFWLLSLLWGA